MNGVNPVAQTGEDEVIENIVPDIVHGALTEALPVFDTVIIAIGDLVLLVLTVAHCPPAIRTLD